MAAIGAAEQENRVTQLAEITALDQDAARQLLSATSWSVEDAIAVHFSGGFEAVPGLGGGGGGGGYAGGGAQTADGRDVPVVAGGPSPSILEELDEEPTPETKPPESQKNDFFSSFGRALGSITQAVTGVASEDFDSWFRERYGAPAPNFSKLSFGDTVRQALSEKKLLLFWFHQDETPATNKLCKDIFQNTQMVKLLNKRFIVWCGDVNRFEPSQISRLLAVVTFPSLVVLQPLKHGFDDTFCIEWPLGTFCGPLYKMSPDGPGQPLDVDRVIGTIMTAAEDYFTNQRDQEVRRASIQQENEMSRMLRAQQDQEYEDALLADQMAQIKKQEEAENVARDEFERVTQLAEDAASPREETNGVSASASSKSEEEQKVADEKKAKEETKANMQARRKEKAAEIHAAPEPPTAGNARIQMRLPNGQRIQRAFLADELLGSVYDWADCAGELSELQGKAAFEAPFNFELCTSFPTTALTDQSKTLKELGLCPSAALVMKVLDDDI